MRIFKSPVRRTQKRDYLIMYAGRIEKLLSHYTPLPMCIVNPQGKVTRASGRIADVFKYDGILDYDIFALTGIKMHEFVRVARDGSALFIKRNNKTFKIVCGFLGDDDDRAESAKADSSAAENAKAPEDTSIIMYFLDATPYENLKELYNNEKPHFILISVDNYDELTASSGTDQKEAELTTTIDRLIRDWGDSMGAATTRYRESFYEIVVSNHEYELAVAKNFPILEKARVIETEADFPVTLSIGIGIGGKSFKETEGYAQEALDMALGRGGDQVVVKNIKRIEYYGGTTQSVEKRNKGKSRIIGHALAALIKQSSEVFIMGHKNPDMDCFGSMLGIHRLAHHFNKKAYLVLGEYNETMTDMVADARATEEYEFITGEKALGLVDDNALAIILDTHRPMLLESLELVNRIDKVVVIDHHRKAEDALPNLVLSYMESYASSAAELVTEILQYMLDKKQLSSLEANGLLAGIMLDTNRFAVKAGVRTFEAASWLKRAGADLTKVRRYFQAKPENYMTRARGIVNARIINDKIAMSICQGQTINTTITNSQVADELLTIKGIEASFVAGRNEKGRTVVSARSLGNINVQSIMEHFGGGGHMNTAGTNTEMAPEEILAEIEKYLHTTEITQ